MNRMEDLIIWTEGGKGIGMGHVNRSLAIARQLQQEGQEVLFLINDDPSACNRMKSEGFDHRVARFTAMDLPESAGTCTFLLDTKKDICDLIRRLKQQGMRVILMDNRTSARLEADVVIYPSPLYAAGDLTWSGFMGRVYGGAEYVPVAEPYRQVRERSGAGAGPPYRILVTMGGSDPNNLTFTTVSALMTLQEAIVLNIIIGPAFSSDTRLNELERRGYPHLRFFRNTNDLSPLMAESHLAVTALGTTIYELACMGVPSMIIANYKEDKADMNTLKGLGFCLPLGHYKEVTGEAIRQAAAGILLHCPIREKMSRKGRLLIDGCGAGNIADVIRTLSNAAHESNGHTGRGEFTQ